MYNNNINHEGHRSAGGEMALMPMGPGPTHRAHGSTAVPENSDEKACSFDVLVCSLVGLRLSRVVVLFGHARSAVPSPSLLPGHPARSCCAVFTRGVCFTCLLAHGRSLNSLALTCTPTPQDLHVQTQRARFRSFVAHCLCVDVNRVSTHLLVPRRRRRRHLACNARGAPHQARVTSLVRGGTSTVCRVLLLCCLTY